jgi:DNA-binding winged helix-turn-helix (wHTH) protein
VPLRFEDFVLDPDRCELRRAGNLIAVEPQVFDLINYLVCRRDRVVTKDELLDEIWGGRVVSESTLTSRINAARRALSDSGDEQRLVRTIARKGFRFIGAVQDQPAAPAPPGVTADRTEAGTAAGETPTVPRPAPRRSIDRQSRYYRSRT